MMRIRKYSVATSIVLAVLFLLSGCDGSSGGSSGGSDTGFGSFDRVTIKVQPPLGRYAVYHLTYRWKDTRDGQRAFSSEPFCVDSVPFVLAFSIDGKPRDPQAIKVTKVEVSSEGSSSRVSGTSCYSLEANYDNPLPENSEYVIESTFTYLSQGESYQEGDKWIFRYTTHLPVSFYLPPDFGLIHASHPVNVKEQGGTVYIEENSRNKRTIELRAKQLR